MKRLKRLWRLLIVRVIVGVIVAVTATVLVQWLTKIDVIGAIWNGLRWFAHLFVISCSLSVWGIILLMLAPLAVVVLVALVLTRRQAGLSYKHYTSDSFFGVSWQWRFCDGRFDGGSLTATCPDCGDSLEYSGGSALICLTCDRCEFTTRLKRVDGPLRERVRKAIESKLDTGEWKAVVKRLSPAPRR